MYNMLWRVLSVSLILVSITQSQISSDDAVDVSDSPSKTSSDSKSLSSRPTLDSATTVESPSTSESNAKSSDSPPKSSSPTKPVTKTAAEGPAPAAPPAAPVPNAAAPTDGCCATCIGKPSNIPYTYDPVIHEQCSAVLGVCCYNCIKGTDSKPDIINGDGFSDDGVTPQIQNGKYLQMAWNGVDRVTYEFYAKNQKKTTTTRNTSTEAIKKNGFFFICAGRGEGRIAVRGWGKDPCTSATAESFINVIKAKSAKLEGQCSGNSAEKVLEELSGLNKVDRNTCNTERATIETSDDGSKHCVCASEWTGPPACLGTPWWKIAVTIGGAIAALLSIAVSVRAFLANRKNKREAEFREKEEREAYNSDAYTSSGPTYTYSEQPTRKEPTNHKEFSL